MNEMGDWKEKYKGNISLPSRLQAPGDMNALTQEEYNELPVVIHTQRAMYNTIISDLKNKIERLTARNGKLEDFFEYVENFSHDQYIKTENDIVELNTNIDTITKVVDNLKQKCAEKEKMRQDRTNEHENKVKQINDAFIETRRRLTSELKCLRAKINSLEEFKPSEEALLAKYNDGNNYFARKEEELQETLKDFELKTKLHRENLKKETYKRVLDASKDFQTDLMKTIPLNVQRMLRENLILEKELVQCWADHANMTVQKATYQNNVNSWIGRIKAAKSQMRGSLITTKIQTLLLKKVTAAHALMKKILSKSFEPPADYVERYNALIDSLDKPEFTHSDFNRRKLEIVLYKERIKLLRTERFKSKTEFAHKACCNALGLIKYAVNSALSAEGEVLDIESFSSYVLNIISDCNSKKWIAPIESQETVELASNVYGKGDLGFDPEHIKFHDEDDTATLPLRSRSTISTLEILKELRKEQEKAAEKKAAYRARDSLYTVISMSIASGSSESSKSDDEKKRKDKLRSFYDEIFGDEVDYEYDMADEYDYYGNYDEE